MKYFLSVIVIMTCLSCGKNSRNSIVALKEHVSPVGPGSAEPFLFADKNNKVYLSWLEKSNRLFSFKYSRYENDNWSSPVLIATDSTWFVNWADYPMIASNASGNFLSHVLAKSGNGRFQYDIKIFLSTNGEEWGKSFLLNDDGKQAEHGFVSIVPYQENFFVTWLDGRNTVMKGMENMDEMDHGGHQGSMSLRAVILNGNGDKIQEWELDNKTCDCCQTTAAITKSGPVVIYRDRSDDEIRDISITRLINNKWTEPTSIYKDNWKIAGCPVNGPRVSAIENNMVVAWFSIVDDVAQVKVIFSTDGGATFNEPIRIDQGKAIGRVDALMLDKDVAIVSWMEGSEIKTSKVTSDGSVSTPLTIASTSESRSSGFPQMAKSNNEIIFAWTDNQEKSIRISSIAISELL